MYPQRSHYNNYDIKYNIILALLVFFYKVFFLYKVYEWYLSGLNIPLFFTLPEDVSYWVFAVILFGINFLLVAFDPNFEMKEKRITNEKLFVSFIDISIVFVILYVIKLIL